MKKALTHATILAAIGIGVIASSGTAQAALTAGQTSTLTTAMKSNNKVTINNAVDNLINTQHASPNDVITAASQFAVAGTISPALTSLELSYVTAKTASLVPSMAPALMQTITQTVVASPLFHSNPTTLSSMLSSSASSAISASPSTVADIAKAVATGLVTPTGFTNATTTSAYKTILTSVVATATAANLGQAPQVVQNIAQVIASTGALTSPSTVTNATSLVTSLVTTSATLAPTQAPIIALDVAQKIAVNGGSAANVANINAAIGNAASNAAASKGQPISTIATIAADLAGQSPSASAQIFLSTYVGLPVSQQTPTNAMQLAIAIDQKVPGSSVTTSITALLAQLKNPAFYTNNPATRIVLTAQLNTALAILKAEESVSPH